MPFLQNLDKYRPHIKSTLESEEPKLTYKMACKIDNGHIEAVDFSSAMVSIARKRNKENIANKKVEILEGDFDNMPYKKENYCKACSVNTIYFWPSPMRTVRKIVEILKPNGKLIIAFEDITQLKHRKLNQDVFNLYSVEEIEDIVINAGFSKDVETISRKKGDLIFHCVVAEK